MATYSALYAELRDKDARQQQAVKWALGVLLGTGLVSAALTEVLSLHWLSALPMAALIALLGWTLDRIVLSLAEERMSIARQLDRIHEVWRVFDEGVFYRGSSLFDPVFRRWGFDPKRDANFQLCQKFRLVIWLASALAISLSVAGKV